MLKICLTGLASLHFRCKSFIFLGHKNFYYVLLKCNANIYDANAIPCLYLAKFEYPPSQQARGVGICGQTALFHKHLTLTVHSKVSFAIIVQNIKHLCQKYKRNLCFGPDFKSI